MAILGNVSTLDINGNQLSIKDAELTNIVDQIIEVISNNNESIGSRINNLHERSFDALIKISSQNDSEIASIQDGIYKLQYVTVTGEGEEVTETLNNSAILIQKGTNQYLYKDGQISSRTKTNNTWGSWVLYDALLKSGGQMSGPIRFGTGNYNDASIILNSKPILADNAQNGGIANDYRYLYRFNSGIELGNHHMYLRLLTDNSVGQAGQSNGLSGDVWHYISNNNRINGTISKYIMLDTRNSSLTDIDYGHKLKLGYNEVNILGVGKLSPELSMPLHSTQLTLNIGGETSTVTIQNSIAAASFTGSHYYTLDQTNSNKIIQIIGSKEGTNNIIVGNGLSVQKVAQEGKTIGANPNTYNIEISSNETQLSKGTTSGNGNAVTDINVSNHQITLVKGATYATQSDIDTSIAALVDSAPETLNTLNELSAALGDDPNFATTIANQIGQKYTKPSTGIPPSDLAEDAIPVTSVNGQTGAIILELEDIAPHDYSKDYLTIVSLKDNNTIGWKTNNANLLKTISISTDGGITWNSKQSSTSGTTLATLNTGDKLLVKGSNTVYGTSSYYNYFTSTNNFNVKGNIMSLIYGDNFIGQTTLDSSGYNLRYLFSNCTKLISAENLILPATTLTTYCYDGMFYSCTSLTTAPELPATTLASVCYFSMFQGCTSLTTTPELPATTLAEECYFSMFQGCTALTTAPELPATTLTINCYYSMFNSCTSLITAPELPATTLTYGCYANMFKDCTSLVNAPELPATTLVQSCYSYMFYGCTSLNYIKCLATNISATYCTSEWLGDVAITGTFIKADNMSDWTTGDDGIPSGWTVYTESKYELIHKYELNNHYIITLKNDVYSFIKNTHYNNNNQSDIHLYLSSKDNDKPLPVHLSNNFGTIYDNPSLTNGHSFINPYIYNLIPEKIYFYTDDSENYKTFIIERSRRFIEAGNIRNVRDLGGLDTKYGSYIKYNKIIRGSEMNGQRVNANQSDIEKLYLTKYNLGITLDLDLRNQNEGNGAAIPPEYAKYVNIPFIMFNDICKDGFTDIEKNKIYNAFTTVVNEVLNGGCVYVHCAIGYHRAGFLCSIIEGVLGVSQCEIDKDYELSSFSIFGSVERTDTNYSRGMNALNEMYNGSWENLLLDCGVTKSKLELFRKAMIVDYHEDKESLYQEVTYSELVELRNTKLLIPGSKYRMIDFYTYDGTQSDFASCSGIPDLPEFKSAYHHFDLLLTAISKSELDSNVKALHSARDTEGYFTNQDLSKWELKYDLDNDKSKYSWAVNDDIIVSYGDKVYYDFFSEHPLGGTLRIVTKGDYSVLDILLEQSPKSGTFRVIENNSKDAMYSNFSVGDEGDIQIRDSYTVIIFDEWINKRTCDWIYYVDYNKYEHIEGKGIIYYMKDEYNNEVPYDFKNIMFKYKDSWYYTFNGSASNIIIKPWIDNLGQHLNRNVFINGQIIKDCFFDFNTHDNILKDNIINVKVGMYSNNNTLINLESVKLGYDNINVYLENFVDSNIGNECYNLELYGNDNVIIVEDFISNKIGAAVDEYTKIYNGIEYSSIKDINTRILYTNGDEKIVKIIGELTKNDLPDFNNIKEVEIGNGVTSIEHSAFDGCLSLTSITIPDSVTSIEDSAFYGCSNLTSITIPEGVTSIGNNAFSNCSGLTSITIPNSVTSIGDYVFYDCSSLTSITIPDSVTRIGYSAFRGCSSLTSITIPNSVTSIGYSAFESCSNLTSVTIPDSVTSIGSSAFQGCSSLTSVTIPDSVTSIGIYAFYGCSSLTSVTIPDSVTSIEAYAFHECRNLTSVTCMPVTPPSLGISPIPTTTATIEVPAQSVDAYKSASGWSSYANKIIAIQ